MTTLDVGYRLVEALKRAEQLFGGPAAVPSPLAHVEPKDPPRRPDGQKQWGPQGEPQPFACLLGSKDDDVVAVCGPVAPQRIWYIDNGNLVERVEDGGQEKETVFSPGDVEGDNNVWLTGPPAPQDVQRHPDSDFWYPLPDGSIGISRWLGGRHLYDTKHTIGPYWGD